jgi:3-deoxy-D-manno-octulosonic-acid transferase
MKSMVLHLLYNFLSLLILPGVLLRLLWRSRVNSSYAERINERFGFYKQTYQPGGIVIHAVSVGETVAAQPLIERYLQAYPNTPITVTSTTPTGSARVKALFGDRVQHVYLPYDYCFALKRFFKMFKPTRLVVMETEWWPNLSVEARKAGIKLCVANGRLSDRSLKGYLRIASLSQRMAGCLDKICVQTPSDAANFIQLGVSTDKVEVAGNIKFDMKVNPSIQERALEFKSTLTDRPIWIAASTHLGEEAIVTQTIKTILSEFPNALCLIVPRHPERFTPFYQNLQAAGLKVARRSLNEPVQEDTQVYLGDTMGELLVLYGAAQIAFVGGSFSPAGGHNMLEAALMDCAIVMGPHLQNVTTQAAQLVQAQGMLVAHTADEFAAILINLFKSPEKRSQLIEHASTFMQANQGAVDRTFISLEGTPN